MLSSKELIYNKMCVISRSHTVVLLSFLDFWDGGKSLVVSCVGLNYNCGVIGAGYLLHCVSLCWRGRCSSEYRWVIDRSFTVYEIVEIVLCWMNVQNVQNVHDILQPSRMSIDRYYSK
jgi:hypothetical protein